MHLPIQKCLIILFMDINPNPGPSSLQGNLNPSRLGFACYVPRRTKFVLFTTRAVTSSLPRQENIYEQVCLSDVEISKSFLQVPTEIILHCSRARCEIDSNTVEQQCRQSQSTHYVPELMVSNVMSFAPRIDEVQEFLLRSDISLAFITET